jgi:hypothetical protein
MRCHADALIHLSGKHYSTLPQNKSFFPYF